MQFITNGPDIPNALLQAHEEGRVVFFCGAGISYPAGLPGFKGLVEQIYRINGTALLAIEKEVFERGQFDVTLDLLERRLPGRRGAVRKALQQVLKPNLRLKGATDTQEALLRLGQSRDGALRLVTTNFDRLFHKAAKKTGQSFPEYAAPMLPIPKNSRWDGVVYLHGLLPEKVDEMALNRLVVTSGDFGLAYLTERWAARFVSELFRNYVVCFVGYSINDPVLRYMMDALAADRMLGEFTPQAWALGDCEPGKERYKNNEWEAKGVTPILYTVPTGTHDHLALHKTLHAWAETYRDRVMGKEGIVARHALTRPSDSTKQDDFVGRMLWALSDRSGLPAKRFADFNPVPSLDWLLDAFTDERFEHSDLTRFGIPKYDEVDEELRFSLVNRPTPYTHAARMGLVFDNTKDSRWDDIMSHLARWLTRHLDDPRLVIWIAQRGGKLHYQWLLLIENRLNDFASMEREGRTAELEEIRLQAPNAIPGAIMRMLWRLLLSGRVKSGQDSFDIYQWKNRLKREGLTTTLRLQLRELLQPKITLTKPFRWNEEPENLEEPTRLEQLVSWELVLATKHVNAALPKLADENWKSALPLLIEDFQQLLRDALDLLHELGAANDRNDPSLWHLPSISPHRQNRGYHKWICLVELLRNAWLAVRGIDPDRASRIAQEWFNIPYPTFKRLTFFAASQDGCMTPEQWGNLLLVDGAWWLWSVDTMREMFRLLALQGHQLTGAIQESIESSILDGPPREMYQKNLEPDRWQYLVARSVWLRLAKLNASGLKLGTVAKARLAKLSDEHKEWQLATNESDEFSTWMSGTGDPDYDDSKYIDIAPRTRRELGQWLKKKPPERQGLYESTWGDVCRKRFFRSLYALCDLAHDGEWPEERWREALQVWSEEAIESQFWRYVAPLVEAMPDTVIQKNVYSVTWWIRSVSKSIKQYEEIILKLCRRVFDVLFKMETDVQHDNSRLCRPVTDAINNPIGHITEAVINLWFKLNPNDNDLLPIEIKTFFTELCNVQVNLFRHGRVLLGAHVISLFRVDKTWTEQHLLPLFNWDNLQEAKAVWEGFLWSPRSYQPLLVALKSQFLKSANHYADLGEHPEQFAVLLTYTALELTEGYTVDEFRAAFEALPPNGLEESVRALYQTFEATGDNRKYYWQDRVMPFWQHIWPKSLHHATSKIAELLTRIIITARSEFPVALEAMKEWLKPIEYPYHVLSKLHESGLCTQFPNDALNLLDAVIKDQQWIPLELMKCLNQILEALPSVAKNNKYRRLQ